MNVIIPAVLAIMIVIGTGFTARKLDWITAESDQGILKLLLNILMPCLIFSSMLNNPFITGSDNSYKAPIFGFLIASSTVLITWLCSATIFRFGIFKDIAAQRPFSVTIGLQNYGFVAIPILFSLGQGDLLGLLMLHNVGVELAVWTTVQLVFTGSLKIENLKKLINGPSTAIVLVMTLNFTGLAPHIPAYIVKASQMIGQAAIPIGIILIGCTLYNSFQEKAFSKLSKTELIQTVILGNVMRSVILPLYVIYVTLNFLSISEELTRVLLIQAAMPAALFPIILSRLFKVRTEVAMVSASSSLLLSLITIPFWVEYGLKLFGK